LLKLIGDAEKGLIPTDKGPQEGYSCKYKVRGSFKHPLKISKMRSNESLKEWYPLKVSFNRTKFKIQEKYWNILRDILIPKNPESKDFF